MDLSDNLDHMNLTDIYRTFHPTAAEYTYVLLKHKQNILQDRSYVRSQNKS